MGGEHTFDDIDRAAATLEAMVTGVDVALLTGPGAARLVTRLVTAERVLASCRSRAMRRAAEANQWRQAGERSPAAWAAKVLGTTTGHAAAELETAVLLDALPATRTARDTGSISGLQAREIAGAATADPAAETLLLRRAGIDDAASLRRRCAEVRAAAETDEGAARERLRRERRFGSWTDPEGGFCFAGRGLPEDGAALLAAIRPHQDAAFHTARRSGGHETTIAYAYDGLIALAHRSLQQGASGEADLTPQPVSRRTGSQHDTNSLGSASTIQPKCAETGGQHDTNSVSPADPAQPRCASTGAHPTSPTCPDTRADSAPASLFDTPTAPGGQPHVDTEEHHRPAGAGADDGHDPGARQLPPLPGVKLIVRIDHAALLRGHTTPGEVRSPASDPSPSPPPDTSHETPSSPPSPPTAPTSKTSSTSAAPPPPTNAPHSKPEA